MMIVFSTKITQIKLYICALERKFNLGLIQTFLLKWSRSYDGKKLILEMVVVRFLSINPHLAHVKPI